MLAWSEGVSNTPGATIVGCKADAYTCPRRADGVDSYCATCRKQIGRGRVRLPWEAPEETIFDIDYTARRVRTVARPLVTWDEIVDEVEENIGASAPFAEGSPASVIACWVAIHALKLSPYDLAQTSSSDYTMHARATVRIATDCRLHRSALDIAATNLWPLYVMVEGEWQPLANPFDDQGRLRPSSDGMKWCRFCWWEQPDTLYRNNPSQRDGERVYHASSYCIPCETAYRVRNRKRNER